MKICLYSNATQIDAVKDMFSAIDNSDLFVDHVVIVPDRFSLLCEKLLLEILPNKALFNVRVRNLTSYSIELLEKLGIKRSEVLSSGEVLLLTQKAIENVKDQLTVYKKSRIAFSYEISKIISQLKSSGVSAEELNENAGGLTGEKYHDLKLIYSEYQRLISGKLDANERLSLLNDSFSGKKLLRYTKLYFAGFDAFTKEGYDLIKNLIKNAEEVNISIVSSCDNGNEYIYDNDIFEKVRELSKECGSSIKVISGKKKFSPHKDAILRGLYSYNQKNCENEGFYNLYNAHNISEEVEAVAKLIRYQVYKGKKYKDIQIAVSDIDKYQSQIENIFDEYNLPYYIDSSLTAEKTLLGRLVLELLDAVNFGLYGERLINLLSFILLGDNSLLIERAQKLCVDSKAKYKKYIEKDFPFADVVKKLEKCKSAKAFGQVVLEMLGRVLATFDNVMLKLEEQGELKERNINLQAFDILKETVELISSYDNGNIEIDEYSKKLKLLLSFREVSTVPTYVDGVMIGDATASFFSQSKVLIIMGGQSLPISSNDNGLFSDEDILMNIKEIQPTIRMINRRNRFKLFSLLSLADSQLFIFYQLFSEEGKKNELPSYIAFLNNIFSMLSLKASNVFFAKNPKTLEHAYLCANLKEIKKISEKTQENDEFSFKNREKLEFSPEKLMFKDDLVKVTELEQFYSCPFKHFAGYGLKLKEKTDFQFDPRDIGNICHKCAEKFVKKLRKEENLNLNVEEFIEDNLESILKEEKLKEKLDCLDERESFLRYIKRQLKANLEDILREQRQSSFKPKYLEKSFNNFKIEVKGKSLSLIGRVDRIDENQDYFRIIDYKTGGTGVILKDLYYGEKLQLFLYQKIAREKLKKLSAGGFYFNAKLDYSIGAEDKLILKGIVKNDEDVIEAFDKDFLAQGKSKVLSATRAKDGSLRGSAISKYNLEELEEYSLKLSSLACEKILEGFIKPLPTSSGCDYCKFKALCGHEKSQGVRLCKKGKYEK